MTLGLAQGVMGQEVWIGLDMMYLRRIWTGPQMVDVCGPERDGVA
jgi:hypothetical protein